jgi:gliding motility-associated lipoprotein GldH
MKYKIFVLLALFAGFQLLSSSCKKGPVFESYQPLKNATWDRFDQKFFEFPVEEENGSYDISFKVRINDKFKYDDLPFYVILTTSSGEERMREVTVNVKANGKMSGTQVGGLYESATLLWKNINMASKGKCKLSIENMIPYIQTEGIDGMGIVVTKSAE